MIKTARTIAVIAAAALVSTGFESCKKYEEGPGLTFRSPEGRLKGMWKSTEIEDQPGANATFDFDKDGKFSGSASYSYGGINLDVPYAGTWELVNDNEDLELTYSILGDDYTDVLDIRMLSNKEMWLADEDGAVSKFEKQ